MSQEHLESPENEDPKLAQANELLAEALRCAQESNHERAKALFKEIADKGYRTGNYNLGLMYYRENEDMGKVIEQFEIAIAKGHLASLFALGQIYYEGDEVPKDVDKALKLFEEAAKKGHVEAAKRAGDIYESKKDPEDLKKTAAMYRIAADKGSAYATFMYGRTFLHPKFGNVDVNKGLEYYLKAARMGYVGAMYFLASIFTHGQFGCTKDPTVGMAFLKAAADRGFPLAVPIMEALNLSEAKLRTLDSYAAQIGIGSEEPKED